MRWRCGECGSRRLLIHALFGAWEIACGKGHAVPAVPGTEIVVDSARVPPPEPMPIGQMRLLADEAHARRTDPDTSHAAAASVNDIRRSQIAVLSFFQHEGDFHDYALWIRYNEARGIRPDDYPRQSPSGLRTRRSELVDAGLVKKSGRKVKMPSGRSSHVWTLVRDGSPE
jgi:hypothetical protein